MGGIDKWNPTLEVHGTQIWRFMAQLWRFMAQLWRFMALNKNGIFGFEDFSGSPLNYLQVICRSAHFCTAGKLNFHKGLVHLGPDSMCLFYHWYSVRFVQRGRTVNLEAPFFRWTICRCRSNLQVNSQVCRVAKKTRPHSGPKEW